jgi:hypothetical protein
MPFAVKMGLNGTGFLGKQETVQRAAKRRSARRDVKAGFPCLKPFETIAEVEEYLSGETVVCMLCGQQRKALGVHLQKIHGLSPDQYRIDYGIPYTFGLDASATAARKGSATKLRIDDYGPDETAEMLAQLSDARSQKIKKGVRFRSAVKTVRRQRTERALAIWNRSPVDHDCLAAAILEQIKKGEPPAEILKNGRSMRGKTWWNRYLNENPVFCNQVTEAVELLPFNVQARMQRLGKRFERELRKLFDAGLSDHQAAKTLGVTAMTCNARTKNWRRAGGEH